MKKDIIAELSRIASKSGGILKPEKVIEEARRTSSPLHSKFQWDDTKAAHLFRLEQARWLIRVTVQIIPNGSDDPERVWVSLKEDQNKKGGGYRTLVSVLSDADLRRQLLNEALQDMKYFEEKYSHLKELAGVFSSIRKLKIKTSV